MRKLTESILRMFGMAGKQADSQLPSLDDQISNALDDVKNGRIYAMSSDTRVLKSQIAFLANLSDELPFEEKNGLMIERYYQTEFNSSDDYHLPKYWDEDDWDADFGAHNDGG